MAKELTVQEQRELLANPIIQEVKKFEMQQRMANMFTTSTIVPDTYRNNVGNCVIAIDMAQRMNANPLMVMQNLYIVHGNPAWSTKFLVACVNQSGRFTPLRYEFKGKPGTKDYGCRCYAYDINDREHKEPLYGTWITQDMVEKEGWSKKQGSKWLTMAEQMYRYRAAAFWSRIYAPEIAMGFPTQEEVMDGAYDVDYEEVFDNVPAAPEKEQPEPDSVDRADAAAEPAEQANPTPGPTPQQAIQDAIRKKADEAAAQVQKKEPAAPEGPINENQSLFDQPQQ